MLKVVFLLYSFKKKNPNYRSSISNLPRRKALLKEKSCICDGDGQIGWTWGQEGVCVLNRKKKKKKKGENPF